MKKDKIRFVAISALALTASPFASALAQVQLACSQSFFVGGHAACGNGSLTINPDGSTNLSGCLVTTNPPHAGHCVLMTGGTPITRNVIVEFATPSIDINSGGGKALVNHMQMKHAGATAPKANFTFTPLEVANRVFLDIGGRLNFSNGQVIGNYTGIVSITTRLQ